ncbi:MAG: glycosyltransferase family 4 protein [Sporichthyaceae bacterium]
MSTPPPAAVRSVFTDSRFGTDEDGDAAAYDMATAGVVWSPYTTTGDRLRLVARVDRSHGSGSLKLSPIEVAPLPHSVGPRRFVRSIPQLTVALYGPLRTAEQIVLRVPGPVTSIAAAWCRLLRRRYAVDVVSDLGEVARSGVFGPWVARIAPIAAAYIRWIVRGAAASRYVTSEALQRSYPPAPGTPTAGISDVHLGPDGILDRPRSYRPGTQVLISVGTMEVTYKAQDVLIDALALLLERGLDVSLTLVGDGRRRADFEAHARNACVAHRVEFAGNIPERVDLNALLDAASVFVMPSRVEGLPRAMVEAMARGLPAVGSDVGGIPELLEAEYIVGRDDVAALADAIAALIADPVAWEAQSARNLEAARAFEKTTLERRFGEWLATVPQARKGT